ncbi:hypothetical protein VP01_2080g1 [Puccinia sorghi]|uniref:Uncharacterized protein n=1 Tax=Puccinia sorghi TaxID=27349 RepID=A0A0L6VC85_9BASI|nr:hypothetical protein VP01_2080g1 [Puccinia sorghi]
MTQGIFNIKHIIIGLTIGLCLAFVSDKLHLETWSNYFLYSSSSRLTSDDHLSWLSWHKVQINNPPPKHDHHHIDPHLDQETNQPPTLKEEIKKIINANKLKLDNFNIIHSNDEL